MAAGSGSAAPPTVAAPQQLTARICGLGLDENGGMTSRSTPFGRTDDPSGHRDRGPRGAGAGIRRILGAGRLVALAVTLMALPAFASAAPAPAETPWRHYGLLGFHLWLATSPGGDTMCASDDGRACHWGDAATGPSPVPDRATRTLTCGAEHRRLHRVSGYERPDDWCNAPEILRAWGDAATSAPQVFQDGPTTTLWRGMPLPRWRAADAPIWVVRGVLAPGAELGLHVDVTIRDRGAMRPGHLSLTLRAGAASVAEPGPAGFRMTGLAPAAPGPVTLALRIDARGLVHFHQAQGWVEDILSPRHEIGQGPANGADGADGEGRLDGEGSEGRPPLWPIVAGRGGPSGGGEAQVKLSFPTVDDPDISIDLGTSRGAAGIDASPPAVDRPDPGGPATAHRAAIDDAIFAVRRRVPTR